jgi:hypothetical protein
MKLKWPHLTWTPTNWPDKTYHAKNGDWSFMIDWVGTERHLRGWHHGQFAMSKYRPTVAALQQIADGIASAD